MHFDKNYYFLYYKIIHKNILYPLIILLSRISLIELLLCGMHYTRNLDESTALAQISTSFNFVSTGRLILHNVQLQYLPSLALRSCSMRSAVCQLVLLKNLHYPNQY
ncbi:LOW QUALITY PROTEIN: hypothetical protein V1477_011047 [Vespula maculifrons]|uniref:Uncharacterized protein n=1 Tax=Vespula maculifrons TaxID=7453 RepID=A0ABD2C3N5_VESMC